MKTDKIPTGNLTAPSNETITHRRYLGGFGQPDGFGGMLRVRVNNDGRLEIAVWSRSTLDSKIETVTIALTNEQRLDLAEAIGFYVPVKMEDIHDSH